MTQPVLLITGAGRGIGAATAKLAASRGYDVAINYKTDTQSAAEVVDAVKAQGRKAVPIQGSMAYMNDWAQSFAEVINGQFRAEMKKRGKEI